MSLNHRWCSAQITQHRVEVAGVAHCDHKAQLDGRFTGGLVGHVDPGDVGLCTGHGAGHTGQNPFAVVDRHHQLGLKRARGLFGPFHPHEAFTVLVLQALSHAAVAGVDDQPFATAHIALDRVARHRAAAGGELHRRVFAAVQRDHA